MQETTGLGEAAGLRGGDHRIQSSVIHYDLH